MALDDRDYTRDPNRKRLGEKRSRKPILDDIPIGSASWVGQPKQGAEAWLEAFKKAQRPPSLWGRFVIARRYRAGFRKPMPPVSWLVLAAGGLMGALPIASDALPQRMPETHGTAEQPQAGGEREREPNGPR